MLPHQKIKATNLSMHISAYHVNGKRNIQNVLTPLLLWKYEKSEELSIKKRQGSP
jgi:hypothetical protein